MIGDTQEERHTGKLPVPQELLGALGKEGAINGVGSHSSLQEKARQKSSLTGQSASKDGIPGVTRLQAWMAEL